MKIKTKISFYISIVFTILFGIVCLIIFYLFYSFRKDEFEERLAEKAETIIKLLTQVKEVDSNVFKIIEQKNVNALYDEKTLIFDEHYNLIYTSIQDSKIKWSSKDFQELKKNYTFFRKDGENDIYGYYYDSDNIDYYAIVSANDKYGNSILEYLGSILIAAWLLFTIATWIATFFIVRNQLKPLNKFQRRLKDINELDSNDDIEFDKKSKNEINLLSNEFNLLMHRIRNSYLKQKEFTAQASHELRTPLARLSAIIENRMLLANEEEAKVLKKIFYDVTRLSEIVSSLLILSKLENNKDTIAEAARLDEAVFSSIEKVASEYPDFKICFNINDSEHLEQKLLLRCNGSLLEIAISNLLKNAYLYSDDKRVQIEITEEEELLKMMISNTGITLSEEDQKRIFEPFMRGQNAQHKNGIGLGLSIVNRVLTLSQYTISYKVLPGLNVFTITF